MRYKYAKRSDKAPEPGKRGLTNPEKYVTGPDPLRREKYYAYLKHRAQARYRGEDYQLTWEDWESFWSDEDFLERGRSSSSLCIALIDPEGCWDLNNVEIKTRREQLQATRRRINDSRSEL